MLKKIDWESQIGRRLKMRDLHVLITVVQRQCRFLHQRQNKSAASFQSSSHLRVVATHFRHSPTARVGAAEVPCAAFLKETKRLWTRINTTIAALFDGDRAQRRAVRRRRDWPCAA